MPCKQGFCCKVSFSSLRASVSPWNPYTHFWAPPSKTELCNRTLMSEEVTACKVRRPHPPAEGATQDVQSVQHWTVHMGAMERIAIVRCALFGEISQMQG